jgi:hypothetical protein
MSFRGTKKLEARSSKLLVPGTRVNGEVGVGHGLTAETNAAMLAGNVHSTKEIRHGKETP